MLSVPAKLVMFRWQLWLKAVVRKMETLLGKDQYDLSLVIISSPYTSNEKPAALASWLFSRYDSYLCPPQSGLDRNCLK